MKVRTESRFRALLVGLDAIVIALAGVWAGFALWYQAPGSPAIHASIATLWALFTVSALVVLLKGRLVLGSVGFAAAYVLLLIWWHQLQPTNDRAWADDAAKMMTGTVAGNQVTLYNVRNFEWRSDSDYTQRWETRHFDLDRLSSVDMIMSYWSGPAIAHMLVSFGFDDAEHVAFSVEIRPERGESFSEIGGFFKEYELSVIAADERDVIRVRTNVRGEDDYLYRINISKAAMRSLFVAYVEEANSLVGTPRFYNTITANCTTLVYHMMKRIVGYLPWNFRLLLTGYLPEYVYGLGGLAPKYSFEELRERGRITARAKAADSDPNFSAEIRRGIPTIERSD